MGRYIVRRLLWVVLVIVVITMLTFLFFFVLPPGDPAIAFAGRQPTQQTLIEVRRVLGLNRPIPVQYLLFVKHLFLGDQYGWPGFGISFATRDAVRPLLFQKAFVTLQLATGALVCWLAIGLPIGILSALKRGSLADRGAMTFALFGVSAPVFWLGIMSLFIFWQKLRIFPGTGFVPFASSPYEWFAHLLLPWVVLALLFAAFYARMVRGNMLDVMSEDYIRTARAKGLPERTVVVKHGLRSTLTPVITMVGLDFGGLIGGSAIVTERVFNIPGLGSWLVDAVSRDNLPVTLAIVTFAAIAITLMNLIVDIIYAYLDPRVRFS